MAVASAAVGAIWYAKVRGSVFHDHRCGHPELRTNLEYLEAEFYTVATTGKAIDQLGIGVTGSGIAGATTGGAQVNFGTGVGNYSAIANEIASDERLHVSLIRGAEPEQRLQPKRLKYRN